MEMSQAERDMKEAALKVNCSADDDTINFVLFRWLTVIPIGLVCRISDNKLQKIPHTPLAIQYFDKGDEGGMIEIFNANSLHLK